MTRVAWRIAGVAGLSLILSAHVGSPDVYFKGNAGPYEIDVIIRPPQVVPGIADISVHTDDSTVSRVAVRPIFWKAGSHGAPAADEAKRVESAPGTYAGKLWLMSAGSSGVDVQVTGPRGIGNVLVPVAALPTGQLTLGPFLKVLLIVLGSLLIAGAVTAGYLAAGESQVAPGEDMGVTRRGSARKGALIATVLLAAILVGGAKWWDAEAEAYRKTLYRPVPTTTGVKTVDGVSTLTMNVMDEDWRQGNITPVVPDHGKLAHMFVIGVDTPFVFAHLHPRMPDASTFVSSLPPLPAGKYRVFTDVVHESGFERTMPDSIVLAEDITSKGGLTLDEDDSWSENSPQPATGNLRGLSGHEGGLIMFWAGPSQVVAGQPDVIRIRVSDKKSGAIALEPYLGMSGHAAVMRDDGKIFVHLHPGGTSSMASQMTFAMRDRGDTTTKGRLDLEKAPMAMPVEPGPIKELIFPYAFPEPGNYTVWVQAKILGRVHTTGYRVTVRKSS